MEKFENPIIILSIITIMFFTFGLSITMGAELESVKDKRYEVFFVGSFPGCSATTMTFKADNNVLLLECMDGYGLYMPILNSFIGYVWAPNYYEGNGILISFIGIELGDFIAATGIAFVGSDMRLVLLTGYLLTI
jgi:hypothetical protein